MGTTADDRQILTWQGFDQIESVDNFQRRSRQHLLDQNRIESSPPKISQRQSACSIPFEAPTSGLDLVLCKVSLFAYVVLWSLLRLHDATKPSCRVRNTTCN